MNSEIRENFAKLDEALLTAMVMSPSSNRECLEIVAKLYIKVATMCCSLQEPTPDCSVKDFTEGLTEAVKKDIIASVAKTCEVNGWEFHPDRNAELRKELLDEN